MTPCPAALSLLYKQYTVPANHGMPCPETSISFMTGRTLPQDESSLAHTPNLFDIHRSMASRELSATRMSEGLSRMPSSSGGPEAVEELEPRRRVGLSDARRRAVVGSEPWRWTWSGEDRLSGFVSDMNSNELPPGTGLPLRAEFFALGEGI